MSFQQISTALKATLFNLPLLRPTYIIPSFNALRVPSNIQYVILDKDNCFARPHTTSVDPAYKDRFSKLVANQPEIWILSNEAGDAKADPKGTMAAELEANTNVKVIKHSIKKPMCHEEIRKQLPCPPENVLVVGDRLYTDVLFANLLGAQSVWIYPGLYPGFMNKFEMKIYNLIKNNLKQGP